jgi:hypothetical protein
MTSDVGERMTQLAGDCHSSALGEALKSGVRMIEIVGDVRTPIITLTPGCTYEGGPSDLEAGT